MEIKISNNKFENMIPGQSIKKRKTFLKTIDGCIEVSEMITGNDRDF